MNPVIERLLSQVYELEGLLTVIDKHGADSTPYLYEMVQKKVERINEYAPFCTPDIYEGENTVGTEIKEESLAEIEEEPITEIQNEEIEIAEVQENVLEDESTSITEEIDQVEDDGFADYQQEEDEGEIIDDDVVDLPVDEEDDVDFDIEESDDNEVLVEDVCFDEFTGDEKVGEEPIRLDEVLQRSLSKDLSKAFSLNDRFRYRRELFGNSEVEMRNTINMVEAMHSFSEAEDYFYGDLEWDRESPEVVDFMTTIRNHFL